VDVGGCLLSDLPNAAVTFDGKNTTEEKVKTTLPGPTERESERERERERERNSTVARE
jgi:methionine synthase II (cobalamin-independent)